MTTGIGICLVYGVSQEAFGYTIKIPPDLEGSPLDLETYQLSVALKVFPKCGCIPGIKSNNQTSFSGLLL